MRLYTPDALVEADYKAVYEDGELFVGWPEGVEMLFQLLGKENTVAIVGGQLGDEGKGRVVDNKIQQMLNFGAKRVVVIRYQGGANAGHTLYTDTGEKVALHQLPSGILYEESLGIMDSGMVIHMEDLQTEIIDAEIMEEVGDLRGKLILSPDAMLATDIDRAQEVLNRKISDGKSMGGTGKAMSVAAGDRLTRRGYQVKDLMAENWKEKFARAYDIREKEFTAHGESLADTLVPDLRETRNRKTAVTRRMGGREEYLDRLESIRNWFLQREDSVEPSKRMIQNTFEVHRSIYDDPTEGKLFEGAQAMGLDPDYGRYPDVTSTPTGVNGIMSGTKFPGYRIEKISERIGVIKLTYMSSVGDARMATDSGIDRRIYTPEEIAAMSDQQQAHAAWIRNEAFEFGTTTGRARDICFFDLSMLRYNAAVGGIEMLAATHLDIAKPSQKIRVCTHYTDLAGNVVMYQPGMENQINVSPQYIELEGWDGAAASKARSFDELPLNAKKFLAFIQRSVGYPIVFVTTGSAREASFEIPHYEFSES